MNIGIIIYSQTGNTYSVAQELKEKLASAGQSVSIERVLITGETHPGVKEFQFETRPEVGTYDALVFGAPVEAFSLASVMRSYLPQVASLKGKKVACFVTKGLPFYWTGGRHAIAQMKKICGSKDATICGTGIVVWTGKGREKRIAELVEKLSKSF